MHGLSEELSKNAKYSLPLVLTNGNEVEISWL
jgi:hypothetical protein